MLCLEVVTREVNHLECREELSLRRLAKEADGMAWASPPRRKSSDKRRIKKCLPPYSQLYDEKIEDAKAKINATIILQNGYQKPNDLIRKQHIQKHMIHLTTNNLNNTKFGPTFLISVSNSFVLIQDQSAQLARYEWVASTQTPIYRPSLSIHITALLTAQEQSHSRNLVCMCASAKRIQLTDFPLRTPRPRSFVHHGSHTSLDHTRTDCVDTDSGAG